MATEAMKGDTVADGHTGVKSRAIYNLCDLHSTQEGRGISYKKLLQSYQITFCGYTVFPERQKFINRFSFRDEDDVELLDSVGIIFIELTKLGRVMKKPVEEMTPAEMWALFYAVANDPNTGVCWRK
jgi:predicted transposase/invertase (TIGR01784 family)